MDLYAFFLRLVWVVLLLEATFLAWLCELRKELLRLVLAKPAVVRTLTKRHDSSYRADFCAKIFLAVIPGLSAVQLAFAELEALGAYRDRPVSAALALVRRVVLRVSCYVAVEVTGVGLLLSGPD